ncbi:VanZ family protein [Devriesea agamarum]|uniref:VanZ family protein n=1 Tax=Devriesea agamarum TaxID=472569 RepID=UPI00071D2B66|nr:VanZ family protein [Devriesea agamarum]
MSDFIARIPQELRAVGASTVWRLVFVAVAIVANVGFYLPKVPAVPGGLTIPGLDKVVHGVVFALTAWALLRILAPRRRFPAGWVVLLLLCHAGVIELVQGWLLSGRSADAWDVLADVVGIVVGVVGWRFEQVRQCSTEWSDIRE